MKNNFFNKPVSNINSRPSLNSEITSQILYGEKFKILSQKKKWIKIKTYYDNYIGYINQIPPKVSAIKINGKRVPPKKDGIIVNSRKIPINTVSNFNK